MARVEPVYEDLPGWRRATHGARRLTDLPPEARTFLRRIEEIVGVPIALVGVGELQYARGQWAEAARYFDESRTKEVSVLLSMCDAYARAGNRDKARYYFGRIVEMADAASDRPALAKARAYLAAN